MVVVVGVACCCCISLRFALMLVLTFAIVLAVVPPAATYGGGISPLTVGTNTLLAYMWWFDPLQLAPVVFFLPPTGTDTGLTLGQLALCGGGFLVVTAKSTLFTK